MSELPSARALPRGFRFASASAGLKKRGHTGVRDVALIVSDPPASAAAVFTQNLVQAPPVVPNLELTATKSVKGAVSGTLELTPDQIADLRNGRLYVQIQSERAPDGNLWGWLLQ